MTCPTSPLAWRSGDSRGRDLSGPGRRVRFRQDSAATVPHSESCHPDDPVAGAGGGGPLFERTSRKVSLTTQRAISGRDQDRGRSTPFGAARCAGVGARGGTSPAARLPVLDRSGTRSGAGCRVREARTRQRGRAEHTDRKYSTSSSVRNGDVDVLITWSPGGTTKAATGDGLTAGPVLGTDARAVIVAASHPRAGRESITTQDLIGHDVRQPDALGEPRFIEAWSPRQTSSGRRIIQVPAERDIGVRARS